MIYRQSIITLVMIIFLGIITSISDGARSEPTALQLCNETSYILKSALAIQQETGSKIHGWMMILPGTCIKPPVAISTQMQVFVYAQSDDVYIGDGLLFDGAHHFCIDPDRIDFTIERRHNCRRSHYLEAGFSQIIIRKKQSTVTFTEEDDFGKRRALTAGIQRLLNDLGYETGIIDGYRGDDTVKSITQFKSDYHVTSRNHHHLITSLLDEARKKNHQRGLVMCNKTDKTILVATGDVKKHGFSTRGWLRIKADQCRHAIKRDLDGRYYFYYAQTINDDDADHKVWAGHFPLCTKTTRFITRHHLACESHGYDTHLFNRIDTGTARYWRIDLE